MTPHTTHTTHHIPHATQQEEEHGRSSLPLDIPMVPTAHTSGIVPASVVILRAFPILASWRRLFPHFLLCTNPVQGGRGLRQCPVYRQLHGHPLTLYI